MLHNGLFAWVALFILESAEQILISVACIQRSLNLIFGEFYVSVTVHHIYK